MQPLQIGVCSWSLKMPDLGEALATIKNKLGLNLVQVGFFDDSYKHADKVIQTVKAGGLEVSATCVGFEGEDYSTIQSIARTGGYLPDELWDQRLTKTNAVAEITARLGVKLLATHIGFVPHEKSDPKYKVMVDRVKLVADTLGERGLTLVMETGQEKAESLVEFMTAVGRGNVGINFDPANMILYGVGDPVEALSILKGRIVHVHMKDANWSKTPTQSWGEEVVLGSGEADIPRVVSKLRAGGYSGPLVVEREAGDTRVQDIQEGIDLLESLLG